MRNTFAVGVPFAAARGSVVLRRELCLTSGTKFLFSAVNYVTVTEARFAATKAKVTPLSIAGVVPGDNWDRLGGCVISRSSRILDRTQR